MKKGINFFLPTLIIFISLNSYSLEYQARYNINGITGSGAFEPVEKWNDLPTVYGAWTNSGSPTNCTTKTPLENTIASGTPFTQTVSGCKQVQTRTVRIDQISSKGTTKQGIATNENQTLSNVSGTIQSVGTKLAPVCEISQTSPVTRWQEISYLTTDARVFGYRIFDKGVALNNTSIVSPPTTLPRVPSVTSGGYIYTRGALVNRTTYYETIYYYNFEICKTPI